MRKSRYDSGTVTKRYYIGRRKNCNKPGCYDVFRAAGHPTEVAYGTRYSFVIGPFRTRRGAGCMANYGWNNPHLQSVADAERLTKTTDWCK